jgi:hypothetical protein
VTDTARRRYTINQLAEMIGVSTPSVRAWIAGGVIAEPPVEPVTQQRCYTAAASKRIRNWHLERCAQGLTRGPGAKKRVESARAELARPVFELVEAEEN